MAIPLIFFTLTKTSLHWYKQADKPLSDLKNQFTSFTIIAQPMAFLQFVVQADSLDGGVGAVLSQRSLTGNKPLET